MSDAFRGDSFSSGTNLLGIKRNQEATQIATRFAHKQSVGGMERNVGMFKASMGTKKLAEGLVKGLKPYAKQQYKAVIKNKVESKTANFAERFSGRLGKSMAKLKNLHAGNEADRVAGEAKDSEAVASATSDSEASSAILENNIVSNEALKATNIANQTARDAEMASAPAEEQAGLAETHALAVAGEKSAEQASDDGVAALAQVNTEADATLAGATATQAENLAVNTTVRASEKALESQTLAGSETGTAQIAEKAGEKVAVKAGEKAVGEGVGEEVGEISGGEAIGAALDATGIGAPLGILIGAITAGLGIHKESEKRIQKMPPMPVNESGSSFQTGIN